MFLAGARPCTSGRLVFTDGPETGQEGGGRNEIPSLWLSWSSPGLPLPFPRPCPEEGERTPGELGGERARGAAQTHPHICQLSPGSPAMAHPGLQGKDRRERAVHGPEVPAA